MFLGAIFLVISIFYWDFGNIFGGGGGGKEYPPDDGYDETYSRPSMLNIETTPIKLRELPLLALPLKFRRVSVTDGAD